MAKRSRFEMWLSDQLGISAFGALEISAVIDGAIEDLQLDRDAVLRFLVACTSAHGDFKSDGHIVTWR